MTGVWLDQHLRFHGCMTACSSMAPCLQKPSWCIWAALYQCSCVATAWLCAHISISYFSDLLQLGQRHLVVSIGYTNKCRLEQFQTQILHSFTGSPGYVKNNVTLRRLPTIFHTDFVQSLASTHFFLASTSHFSHLQNFSTDEHPPHYQVLLGHFRWLHIVQYKQSYPLSIILSNRNPLKTLPREQPKQLLSKVTGETDFLPYKLFTAA